MISQFFRENALFLRWTAILGSPLLLIQIWFLGGIDPMVRRFILGSWIFLLLLTILLLILIEILIHWKPHVLGFAFLATILVKLAASVVFFYPEIQTSKTMGSKTILHFFIPYFLFLTLETLQVFRRLNTSDPEAGNES